MLEEVRGGIMQAYKDSDNNSNIVAYEIGDDLIVIKFCTGRFKSYKYTTRSTSSHNISEMKKLASLGDGLNSFISNNKPGYESKW